MLRIWTSIYVGFMKNAVQMVSFCFCFKRFWSLFMTSRYQCVFVFLDVIFIPCYTQCLGIRLSRKTAHMHCCCGEIFSNDNFENHRQYNCTADMHDWKADAEMEETEEEEQLSTNQTTCGWRICWRGAEFATKSQRASQRSYTYFCGFAWQL